MLKNIKTILYLEHNTNYNRFLDIITKKSDGLVEICEISTLEKNIEEFNSDKIFLMFIDCVFMDKLSEETRSILSTPNFICIILTESSNTIINRESYIYDILVCENSNYINNFLLRLEDDLKLRIDYHFLQKKIRKFDDISMKLTTEKNISNLLDLIIDSGMELTYAEAGSVYIVVDKDTAEWSYYEKHSENKCLKFILAKNKALQVNLEQQIVSINKTSIHGCSVITGESIRIDDVYNISNDVDYKFNSSFDLITGYRTKSMLNVPLKDHQGRILGVIQLINKINKNISIPFDITDELLVSSLAGLAAVAIENAILHKTKEKLLEEYRLAIKQEVIRRTQADKEVSKLLSAVEHSPISVVITDANGFIEYVNSKFTQLTGYNDNEVIGRNISIFESGEHSEEFYKGFWEYIQSGKDWYGELRNKKKNGELYWELISISSIKDKDNNINNFVMTKEDTTEKKLIFELLESKNLKLQSTINELNNAQIQLVQKEKMASVGQLAAGIAHEINNPLGFIISNHETMQKYIEKLISLIDKYKDFSRNYSSSNEISLITDYENKSKLEFIKADIFELHKESFDGLNRIGVIVNALRAFSHIDQIDDFEKYNINQCILDTLIVCSSKIKYTNIIIEKHLSDIPYVQCNSGDINQVLLNLFINAIDAIQSKSPEDIGTINIQTYVADNHVCFDIEDDGIGIPEEIQNKIFEPFYTTKQIGEGTGLGLSICYDIIVKKHHGEILLQSRPGIGAKFTVKLPT